MGKYALDYLANELPEWRKRYEWAPRLYGQEIAHIDAILELVEWAYMHSSPDDREGGLSDVIETFAIAYGWTPPEDGSHG